MPFTGTAAAAWQAASGPIAAHSLFSILQSAAMGGYGVSMLLGAGTVGTAVGVLATAIWKWFWRWGSKGRRGRCKGGVCACPGRRAMDGHGAVGGRFGLSIGIMVILRMGSQGVQSNMVSLADAKLLFVDDCFSCSCDVDYRLRTPS